MGPNSDTGKAEPRILTGKPLAEVGEIKIPLKWSRQIFHRLWPMLLSLSQWMPPVVAAEVGGGGFSKPGLKDLIHRIFHFEN